MARTLPLWPAHAAAVELAAFDTAHSAPAGCRVALRPNLAHAVLWMMGALLLFRALAVSVRALAGALKIMEFIAAADR
jgi:hypothetical protein